MDAGGVRSWIRGSVLGAGSFARVSLAVDSDTGELFAVKSARLDGSKAGSLETEALENELRILESISSPRIVRCLGSCWSTSAETGEKVRNVFLEYMPGGSISDLMVKLGGRIHERLARVYTKGILEGLHFLHQRGIVHCDIKGKNVLVGSSGVKLADFGSARDDGSSIGCLSAKGTPLWMAPEVVRQEEQGPPSDIWSLGCTVLEMVTGKAPWSQVSSETFAALYRIGCTDELPTMPPAAVLSEQGRDFVAKCLERDPCKRWSTSQLLQHPFVTEPLVEQSGDDENLPHQQQSGKLELPKLELGAPVAGDSFTNSPGGSPAAVGKWIVVRSPSGISVPDPFSHLSDFEDEGSTDEEAQRQEQPAAAAVAAAPAPAEAEDEALSSSSSRVVRFSDTSEAEESGSCSSCFSNRDDASYSFTMPSDRAQRFRVWPGGRDGGADDLWVRQLSKLGSSWVHLKHRLLWRMLERQSMETLTAHGKKGRVEAVVGETDSSSSQDVVSLIFGPANVTNFPFHVKLLCSSSSPNSRLASINPVQRFTKFSSSSDLVSAWLSLSPTHACSLRLCAVPVHC